MTTSDPRPVSDSLATVRRSMIATVPDDLEDPSDIALMRDRGLAELNQSRWVQLMPSRFAMATLEGCDDPVAVRRVRGWISTPRPPNLILLGTVGSGKTSLAVAACRPAFDAHREIMFAPIGELLDALRPGGDPGILADLCGVDRLIIDDLGAERETEWTTERLGIIINRRWMEERPTIVTSNLRQRDCTIDGVVVPGLESRLGEHMASRLFGGAVTVTMKGTDRRRG